MKYNFQKPLELTFDFVSHTYQLTNREMILHGVTDIIKQAGLRPEFRGNQFAQINAMNRGSNIHLATAFNDKGTLDESTLIPEYVPYLEQWRRFRAETGAQILAVELPLYSKKYLFAGTIDRIVLINGILYLLDIKTGGTPHISTKIQLAGYWILLTENFPGYKFQPIAVQLTPKNYKKFEYKTLEKDSRTFLSGVDCYWWARENNLLKGR